MASNYEEICAKNRENYGKVGAKKSGDLAAGLYDDQTHFIYELLQNAEDALKRRGEGWKGSRQVKFNLSGARLDVSHFGHPFTPKDVWSVCDISESTKDENSIGRFGLGFKSVYKVSDSPEIHSGDEDFVIDGYVFPRRTEKTLREADETQIVLPLKLDRAALKERIAAGFKALGAASLLFLRNIREISWSTESGASGLYLRDEPEALGSNVSRVKVIGQASGAADVDQEWLVFHRDVGKGRVELAFSVIADRSDKRKWTVQPLPTSPLFVFFPTAYATNLGFYLQGPFQSTPSRDNIKSDEPWNHHLVAEAASLLVEAMDWLRTTKRLDINALRCLPLDRAKFPEGGMFTPMFEAVLGAFRQDAFLPNDSGGYSKASDVKFGRTADLRELFDSEQLSELYGKPGTVWLTGEITQDRANDLRTYTTTELGIQEVAPRDVFPKLSKSFLEAQSDAWIKRVYEYLKDQVFVRALLASTPIVRLSDGTHVAAKADTQPNAFLPTDNDSGFPTVRASVCDSEESRDFLQSIGIQYPDPVDAVIRNVLPKYQVAAGESIDTDNYDDDIVRILAAYKTDSTAKRNELLEALKSSSFVMAVDTGDGRSYLAKPGEVYIASDRISKLFAGVDNISIVDTSQRALRGENIRTLLDSCGAARFLRTKLEVNTLTHAELRQLREAKGLPDTTYRSDRCYDWDIEGLDDLLTLLPTLPQDVRVERAKLLWDSLDELESKGRTQFGGTYSWTNRGNYSTEFPAHFVRRLIAASWVPDANGQLHRPNLICFDDLGWKENPFLQSRIVFKPNVLDQLAREADVDPAALDLLRKFKLTEADLAALVADKYGVQKTTPEDAESADAGAPAAQVEKDGTTPAPADSVYDENRDLYGEDLPTPSETSFDPEDNDIGPGNRGGGPRGRAGHGPIGERGSGFGSVGGPSNSSPPGDSAAHHGGHGKRSPGSLGGRPFISYVAAEVDAEQDDPDGLDQSQRMDIEAAAIKHILKLEPQLHTTEAGNEGFDLLEKDVASRPVRWIEVKAMTGSLDHRPATLSKTQFEHALHKREAYWLYIVEFASTPGQTRVLRIQDPAGNAKTFTFDRGWSAIAMKDLPG